MAALLPQRIAKRKAIRAPSQDLVAGCGHRHAIMLIIPDDGFARRYASPDAGRRCNVAWRGRDGTMNDRTNPPKTGEAGRKNRLAEQLRANLQKRKAQSRSRRTGDADTRPEGLAAAGTTQKE